jgi:N-acetylmuramoyl-L-alanine amidase
MSNYLWILCAGHGGIKDGIYQTSEYWWKRSYFLDGKLLDPNKHTVKWLEEQNNLKIYEGEMTRDVVKRIKHLCDIHKYKYVDIVDSEQDISLRTRVQRANEFRQKDNPILLSIHHNAFTKESANGYAVYTTPGFTNSDIAANYFYKEMKHEFPTHTGRSDYTDNDPDKEALFYIIKYSWMPAVLTESLFYTNFKEASLLHTELGRQRIANAHFRAMSKIENDKPF